MSPRVLHGIPVSAGISIGHAFFMNRGQIHYVPRQTVPEEVVPQELERLEQAFAEVTHDFETSQSNVPEALKEQAAIINSHLMILNDPKLLGSVKAKVGEMHITAEWGLEKAVGEIAQAFEAVADPYIRDRVQDVRVVADRVMAALMDQGAGKDRKVKAIKNRVVLMAHDLTPADTVGLEVDKIMSFATVEGGKTSHTGILARSLQIPAVVGVSGLEEHIGDGDLVIVDGLGGKIIVDPDEAMLATYSDLKYQFEAYHTSVMRQCVLPGETIDGFHLGVHANIELFEEVTAAMDNGCEGIGLYRTEYAFMNRPSVPTEEELYDEYKDLVSILDGKRAIFRTLDIGADKLMQSFGLIEETNPALGLRAIRFSLRHTELFKRQLRAILRAGAHGNAAIMFPLISGRRELTQAKYMLAQAQRELMSEGLPFDSTMPVGIMIELPSAVMIADVLAREVDFFSIGTNDLIQYSLGIDRSNRHVSYLYQPLHPAIVRSIKHVVDMGHQMGIEVNVCGELASDPYCVPILMGMQIDGISITPQAIPGIKRIIRQTTLEDCKSLLKEILSYDSVSKINRSVKETVFKQFPEELMFYSSLLDQDDN